MSSDERIHSGLNDRKKDRNSGIDLLRNLSMLMIASLHVLGQGGVMAKYRSNLPTYYVCWLLETACLCAVNCFGMISGYVGIRSEFRIKKLIRLILTVEFYSLLLLCVLGFRHPEWLNRDMLLSCILPLQWKSWWYYSAYAGLYLLTPFLNRAVKGMTKTECKKMMLLLFGLFSVSTMVSKVYGVDFLELIGGYSLIWLIVLYIFGACLREYTEAGGRTPRPLVCVTLYLVLLIAAWGWKVLTEFDFIKAPVDTTLHRMLLTYTSPTIFGCGILLVICFSKLRIRSERFRALISFITPSAFFIYILHTHPLVWEYILKGRFRALALKPPAAALAGAVAAACSVFLLCLGLDLVRRTAGGWIRKKS